MSVFNMFRNLRVVKVSFYQETGIEHLLGTRHILSADPRLPKNAVKPTTFTITLGVK